MKEPGKEIIKDIAVGFYIESCFWANSAPENEIGILKTKSTSLQFSSFCPNPWVFVFCSLWNENRILNYLWPQVVVHVSTERNVNCSYSTEIWATRIFQEKSQVVVNVRFLKITQNRLKQSILNLEYGYQLL